MKTKRKYLISFVIILVLLASYFALDYILFDGIKPKLINKNNFKGNFYSKKTTEEKTTVILIGGGQWGDYWAQYFAKNNMVGFSIPYFGQDSLPRLPEEIELEYFEDAINWLKKQPEVNPKKIVVMGASRNAELALLIASNLNHLISGVVAYAPSSVSWSNTVLPYNSDEMKASWKYQKIDIPYIPMKKIKGSESEVVNMLDYWEKGLKKIDYIEKASIKVEQIKGSILLISGNDDKVWPSSKMADMIEKRLKDNRFEFLFKNFKYDNAGHSISNNPDSKSSYQTNTITIDGKKYKYEFGGTVEGNFKAKQNARCELMKFLKEI